MEAADNREGLLYGEQQWNIFVALMQKSRLAGVRDVQVLETVRPAFPLTFETFINTVQQKFGDASLKALDANLDEAREQLENCRSLINLMNISFLKRGELHQLAKLVHKSHQQGKDTLEAARKIYKEVKGTSEDVYGFVWDRIDGTDYKSIKLPHEVIKQEKASLEREFNSRRVRSVHYRKQPIKIIKLYQSGIVKQLAYCSDKGFPVECYKIPKCFEHYELLTQFFNQIGATKELLLSKYCPSYLGFDDMSDPEYNQYFFEIKKGKPLKKLMTDLHKTLLPQIPLFKYWAKELLYAFRDITYKSTFCLQKNLSLKNVYVSDIGIKVYLKKIKFGEQRDNNLDYHMHVESQMLKMYAKLLIEMLTNRDESHEEAASQLEKLQIEPELKCILYECLQAEQKTQKMEEDAYQQEISQHVEREARKARELAGPGSGDGADGEDDLDLVNQFKELVAKQKSIDEEQN